MGCVAVCVLEGHSFIFFSLTQFLFGGKLDFLFRKETRNLYWNGILSDKMEDSCGDYVFFDREKKTNSPKKIQCFLSASSSSSSSPSPASPASPSHHFLAKSPSSANLGVGHLNGSLRNKKSYISPERTWGRNIQK